MDSRRRFLQQLAAGAAASVVAPGVGCTRQQNQKKSKSSRPRVVVVRDLKVIGNDHRIDRERLAQMLERGLRRLGRTRDARAALSRWVRPVDTAGLKVNCLAGRQMSTHLELTEALVALLEKTGLSRQRCVVFDRSDLDLRRAGYPVRLAGKDYRSLGNDRAGYERKLRVMKSGASRFSRVATEQASVLINLPILKDHGIAGISGALKNNFGLVNNPNKFHLNGCDPHVAEVNGWDFVRRKQHLVICDALRVQVEGGPAYHPAGAVRHGALLLAEDPVALDRVAWDLLERLRKTKGLPSLKQDRREPVHILTAARQGLGVAQRGRIEIVEA